MIAGLWKLNWKTKINSNVLWRNFWMVMTFSVEDFGWFCISRLQRSLIFNADFFDTWTSDGSSALWMLVLTTCSLASRNIFEHKFHGWFFDSLNA
ncbi:unnamed protein product [Rhizophagus irregularis]|nr:unnamed protein product [Rhizophagus irregularis]